MAALIARNQTVEIPYYFNLALDNGVKPGEISEIITHLAFYSGWANAMSAVVVAKDIFGKRGIGSDQLPPASGELLPIDEAAEAQRLEVRVEHDIRYGYWRAPVKRNPFGREPALYPALSPSGPMLWLGRAESFNRYFWIISGGGFEQV